MAIADNALTTLERLKQFNGIDANDTRQDFKLELLINSASEEIGRYIGRQLKSMQHKEKYTGNNRLTICLRNYPVTVVNAITINGIPVDQSEYRVYESGIVERSAPWPSYGLQSGISQLTVQPGKNIDVDYVAGYVLPKDETEEIKRTLPFDIEFALFRMVSNLLSLSDQGVEGLKSFSISDVRWEWDKDYMQKIQSELSAYRVVKL